MNYHLDEALDNFEELTKNVEVFLSNDKRNDVLISGLLKRAYDFTKQQEIDAFKSNALPELITENFDTEQIWQQVELQNDAFLAHCLANVSKFVLARNKLVFTEVQSAETTNQEDPEPEDAKPEPNESSSDEDNASLHLDEDSDEATLDSDDLSDVEIRQPQKKSKTSAVDDDFFKLDEMEAFLQAEERKMAEPDSGNNTENEEEENEDDDEEEDVDMFDNINNAATEAGGINNPKYNDFFKDRQRDRGGPSGSSRLAKEFKDEEETVEQYGNDVLSDEEYEKRIDNFGPKSTLEERDKRLHLRIEELEENAVGEKPWQLKGEITAESRPHNSLLEEVVDFDMTSRPAPIITEKTTFQLEDIIRQRIKDSVFDSVERKEKHVETPVEYKKKLVLDQEKSKESLAQIYEKEFLKQAQALDPDTQDKDEEEPQLHKDIKKMMLALFSQLDSLSNFHFTPKLHQPELKVVSNLPALSVAEVAPVGATEGSLLAPQDVKAKIRGDIIGKSERTDTDKKRERHKKKAKQHKHALIQRKKEQLGLGNKYSKEKADKMLERVAKEKNVDKMDESTGAKSVKSSTAFFTQLQEEVKSQIKNKSILKKKKQGQNALNAKKLKL